MKGINLIRGWSHVSKLMLSSGRYRSYCKASSLETETTLADSSPTDETRTELSFPSRACCWTLAFQAFEFTLYLFLLMSQAIFFSGWAKRILLLVLSDLYFPLWISIENISLAPGARDYFIESSCALLTTSLNLSFTWYIRKSSQVEQAIRVDMMKVELRIPSHQHY